MSHLMRQQNQHEREREGNSQQKIMPAQCPEHGEDMLWRIECKRRKSALKIRLEPRPHNQGRKNRHQQQQNVYPISGPGARDPDHTRAIGRIDFTGNENFWGVVGHRDFFGFYTVGREPSGLRLALGDEWERSWDVDAIGRKRQMPQRYSIDWSSLPGLNRTAFPGGIETSAPVRGLRPIPVLRGRTLNTPNPRNSMRSPLARERFMLSNTVSTAISALVLVIPVRFTTSLIMSSLITCASPRQQFFWGSQVIDAKGHNGRLSTASSIARGAGLRY